MSNLIATKIVVAVLFGIIRFFAGILPIKLHSCLKKWEGGEDGVNFINERRHAQVLCLMACCQSFGGGVLFATCFLHMMPEVYFSVEELKRFGHLNTKYPMSQLTISFGFFLIYFLEEISHWFISKVPAEPVRKAEQLNKVTPVKNGINKSAFTTPQKTNYYDEDLAVIPYTSSPFMEKLPTKDTPVSSATSRRSIRMRVIEDVDDVQETKELEEVLNNVGPKSQQQIIRCILVELALSLHAIFEGLAIGLQSSVGNIWYLFTAVSIHSATILFCIGVELVLAKTKKGVMVFHFFILAVASPFGVLLGLLITLKSDMDTEIKSVAIVLLEGLSAGTILYITFFEVLNREKERRVYRLRRAVFILSGFVLMALLKCGETYL
ncbi:zinc transporter ZIP3-like [Coccinella septempunctata]|uniref:zinc transporter ZIP3-like n=1 Tax=Coccinella septempunctata TaxID=41139 RepID=UPI001D07CC39|nr:zinc transporter ZIP3-like [Coccinella septempunctata]